MPLHLLGKKSWNVYNQDSIARVRRDEAEAELRKREERRRIEEDDAESRLQLLRGVRDGKHELSRPDDTEFNVETRTQHAGKKRRLSEDDTGQGRQLPPSNRQRNISLTDKHGHINLFLESDARKANGNAEVAAEFKKKQQDFDDQYTMKFSNAAGKHIGSSKPWYSAPAQDNMLNPAMSKNIWGKDDPKRPEREKKRIDANDPLAAIKRGVKQLREADKHRQEWRDQRELDLNEVEKLAKTHRHRKKRRKSDEDSLEGFDLDEGFRKDNYQSARRRRKASPEGHRRRHKHTSRSHKHDEASSSHISTPNIVH